MVIFSRGDKKTKAIIISTKSLAIFLFVTLAVLGKIYLSIINNISNPNDAQVNNSNNKLAHSTIATANWDYSYDMKQFTSRSRSTLLSCNPPPPTNATHPPPQSYLSQSTARSVLKKFVDARTAANGKPRFVPALNELMHEAHAQNQILVTVQLGGMDGKTGDPMYRFTEFHSDISNWMPVVMEPVPENFEKLVQTYKSHMVDRKKVDGKDTGVTCPHVLHQMSNYDESLQTSPNSGMCPFCHFDYEKEECKSWSDFMKKETGSMECGSDAKKKCFKATPFPCTTIKEALMGVGLHPKNVAALQMDVEGFEVMMLRGYFDEISPKDYPPLINFESKVLKGRKQYDELEQYLKQLGYGVHAKHVDSLAIWGAQGLD